MVYLNECKNKIFDYIESRMMFIAPNVTAIVGPSISARIMGKAGGLAPLAKIPACNLQVLGNVRKHLAGFSTADADLHVGFLAETDLVLGIPKQFKYRAVRLIAGKTALAARVDTNRESREGELGQKFRDEIEAKLEKWQEPPPSKVRKALPVPLPPPRKKRGGKRYRKMREKFRVTETQKMKNRMAMGTPELTDEFTGEGFGMLGKKASGHVAIRKENTQKLSKSLSKKTQSRMRRIRTASAGTSGAASSIAFTPVQGMEFVDQNAGTRKNDDSDRYFNSASGFQQVGTKRLKSSTD
jgi:U4/U6 small nuclear ribonucleoprotein PRP31